MKTNKVFKYQDCRKSTFFDCIFRLPFSQSQIRLPFSQSRLPFSQSKLRLRNLQLRLRKLQSVDHRDVTKSPGTLPQRTARRIQRGECPQPCFHTGRNIHTHKSPRPLSMTMARRILRLILLTRLRSNDPSWLVPLPDRPRRQRSTHEV